MACNGRDRAYARPEIVRLLLQRQADVNSVDKEGRRPLHLAAGSGVTDAARILVEAGADIWAKDNSGKNALDKAMQTSGSMRRCPGPSSMVVGWVDGGAELAPQSPARASMQTRSKCCRTYDPSHLVST